MMKLEGYEAVMEVQTIGAQMTSYHGADGKPLLWRGDPNVWGSVSPLLFPVIGRLKNQRIRIAGKECALPVHGFARNMEFSTLQQEAGECVLALRDTPETREVYPFSFCLTVTHRILPGGFQTIYEVENTGDSRMPFTIGAHPGFVCPMHEGAQFADYVVRFAKPEQGIALLCTKDGLMGETEKISLGADDRTISLDYGTFDEKDTLVFPGIISRSVELVHAVTGKGIRFSFPQASCLAVWTATGACAPYLCVEPWNGLPAFESESGDFENKPYHIALAPGERFHTEYIMESLT